ncbi:MAG TPA: SRPBCC family protein, partial [Hyphomicrobiaceae bacterium]|nr:SRPBCC family protein [Hyphomicrobiaceae bacterium]
MIDILIYVAIALVVLVVALVAYAATKPDAFRVQRSTGINAPAERIFPLIANLKSMNTWNPFVEPDPAIKIAYSGPDSGKGAAHTWSGNSKVGEGRLEITDAAPSSRVTMRLDMLKPMKASNLVEFTLQPTGASTAVSWAMSGRQPFMAKLMTVFIDCDKMVGSQFEKGLGKLKAIAER